MERALCGKPPRPAALVDFLELQFSFEKLISRMQRAPRLHKAAFIALAKLPGPWQNPIQASRKSGLPFFSPEKYVIIDDSGQKSKIGH